VSAARDPRLWRVARGVAVPVVLALLAAGVAVVGAQPRIRKEPPARDTRAAALRARLADTLRAVLDRAAADSAFPGAYAVVGDRRGVLAEYGVGRIDWAADAPPPDAHTLWDVASLTKVVATTSAIAQLVEQGRVALDAPVQRYLPDWSGPGKARVRVRHLLTHSSGLPAWRPLYKEATDPASALALVMATPLDTAPGVRFVYSDLNAILLGRIVERVSGEALDAYVARHVFTPLAMGDTRFRPPPSELARIAPTEFDPWRQRLVRGEPHDENAFALGGVAGHAGLFSSAADLARFARMYLNGGELDGRRVVRGDVLARFTRVQDPALSRRALGWETPTGGNSAGHRMSARAFGHTGFTGTSLWMDPERDVFVVLLTNRVNPTRQNTRIGAVRVALADAALGVLGAPVTSASAPPTSPPPSRP
jgi:CubicO group peptidase (beta-lactamase class C family)